MSLLLALAAATATFNLDCEGLEVSGNRAAMKRNPPVAVPFRITYRVNLTSGRWCSGDCLGTSPLYTLSARGIWFEHQSGKKGRMELSAHVDRETGNYDYVLRTKAYLIGRTGKCKRSAFTDFPRLKR